jgi:cytochrome c oxidase subunit 1
MHALGLHGMTRRIYTYDAASGWGPLNLLASLGAAVIAVSVVLFFVNIIRSLRSGAVAPDNPWDGTTLEWGTTSPPPSYGFVTVPVVQSRQALRPQTEVVRVDGLPTRIRALLVTRMHDAEPDYIAESPHPTPWPFISAVAVSGLFIATIFTAWGLVWGSIPVTIALIGWFWPRKDETQIDNEIELKPHEGEPAVIRSVDEMRA